MPNPNIRTIGPQLVAFTPVAMPTSLTPLTTKTTWLVSAKVNNRSGAVVTVTFQNAAGLDIDTCTVEEDQLVYIEPAYPSTYVDGLSYQASASGVTVDLVCTTRP